METTLLRSDTTDGFSLDTNSEAPAMLPSRIFLAKGKSMFTISGRIIHVPFSISRKRFEAMGQICRIHYAHERTLFAKQLGGYRQKESLLFSQRAFNIT